VPFTAPAASNPQALAAAQAAGYPKAGDTRVHTGLWYPVVFAAITVVVGVFFLPETKGRDIH